MDLIAAHRATPPICWLTLTLALAAGCAGNAPPTWDGAPGDSRPIVFNDGAESDAPASPDALRLDGAPADAAADADVSVKDGPTPGCKSAADCDDGDGCNGEERCDTKSGACLPALKWTCPVAPPECNQSGGAPGPSATKALLVTNTAGLRLRDEGKWTANDAIIKAIEAHASTKAVTLDGVLKDLNRSADQGGTPPQGYCLNSWFRWNAGDRDVAYWYPQGTSGSATGVPGVAKYSGRFVLLVSWYHKPDKDPSTSTNKGARLSVADITTLSATKYRHVLLVEPTGKASYKPIAIHAGGIAWYKDWLYVADTSNGLRVFNIKRLIQVQTGDKNAVGLVTSKNEYHAFNYRYVLPQLNRYSLCATACCARFSFVSVDLTSTPHSLITGEYSAGNIKGRLMRWPLDPATGKLKTAGGAVVSSAAYFPGVKNMQGGAAAGSRLWISTGVDTGVYKASLRTALVGQAIKAYGYPWGPEDLHYSPGSTNLWSNTEFPGSRFVYSVKSSKLLNGCK